MAIKVVDIIVERKGMILLIKRGDFWILPGGEIEQGEDDRVLVEAVFFQLREEVAGPGVHGGDELVVALPVLADDRGVGVVGGEFEFHRVLAHYFERFHP